MTEQEMKALVNSWESDNDKKEGITKIIEILSKQLKEINQSLDSDK